MAAQHNVPELSDSLKLRREPQHRQTARFKSCTTMKISTLNSTSCLTDVNYAGEKGEGTPNSIRVNQMQF